MLTLAWIILLLPLLSALGIALAARRNNALSGWLSLGAVSVGFVLSLIVFGEHLLRGGTPLETSFAWLRAGEFELGMGVRLDSLSVLMLLVVTGVGALIHWYSQAYMAGDKSYARYFAGLSLFTFSMLGIVLASGFGQMFIFWELVGLSSYLLIGFWFEKPSAAEAAKKAFLVNRLGDFGFILGIIMVWSLAGALNFALLEERFAADPELLGGMALLAGLLVFCGAVGKSAQFPLHIWLPDAMEGPTPVSALIHAATMVAAGVYMLCRVYFIFTPEALTVIAWVGGITALLGALAALKQNDIKRVLAFSTLSQLGYMVMAVGLHAPGAAMYHLTTHALFKALLFLGAGSVIYAAHHEQNIWRLGGLRRRMPTTYWTFVVGALALCGVPPLSGFFSKDAILAAAADVGHGGSAFLFGLGVFVAGLTVCYMLRLLFVVFHGAPRSAAVEGVVESPSAMRFPLVILAVGSAVAGLVGVDGFVGGAFGGDVHGSPAFALLAMAFSLLGVVLGGCAAWWLYWGVSVDPIPDRLGWLRSGVVCRRCGFFVLMTHEMLAQWADWVDRRVLAGFLVRGAAGVAELAGRALRLVQSGNLGGYVFLFVVGVVAVIYFVLGGWFF